jgi:hypothetical protein
MEAMKSINWIHGSPDHTIKARRKDAQSSEINRIQRSLADRFAFREALPWAAP